MNSRLLHICQIFLIAFAFYFLFFTFTQPVSASTWNFTNNIHPSVSARYLQSSFSGSNNTYSGTGNFTGERLLTNGTSTNRWTTETFSGNVTIPAGTWTFSVVGNSSNTTRGWYPRIKIYDSSNTLIYTSTSPNYITGSTYQTNTWTDSVPAFNVGPGLYYSIEVWRYHTIGANRTERLRINSTDANYIIDTYVPSYYTPKTRSWHFYDDHTPETPSISYAPENNTPNNMYNHNDIRLRLSIAETGGVSQTGRIRLQFSSDGISYSDVGEIGSGAVWAYCDGGGADDNLVSSLLVSSSTNYGPFIESSTAASTFNHVAYQTAEFDYCLQENFAYTDSTYYFRAFHNTTGLPILPDSGYIQPNINISNHNKILEIGASFNLDAINLDDAPGPTNGSFNDLFIRDYTGALLGWSATATATDFTDGLGNSITIDNLTMSSQTISPQLAESTSGITLGNGTLSNTVPLNIATASSGYGAGNFTINGTFSLYIPIATAPGSYTSVMTLTLS